MASARASLASILTALLGAGGFALADDAADPLAEFGVPGEALSDQPYTLGVGASIAMPLTPDTDLGDRGEEAGITVFYRGESYGAGLFVQGSTEAGTGDFELGGAGLAGMIYGDNVPPISARPAFSKTRRTAPPSLAAIWAAPSIWVRIRG